MSGAPENKRPVITVELIPGRPDLMRIGFVDPEAIQRLPDAEVGAEFRAQLEAWQANRRGDHEQR